MNLSGIIYETVRPEPVEGIFTVAKSLDKACPEHGEGLSPNGSNANRQSRFIWLEAQLSMNMANNLRSTKKSHSPARVA
jgi:hypothetical protein